MQRLLLLLICANSAGYCAASEYHLLQVEDLSVEYQRYQGVYRNAYMIDDDGEPMQFSDGAAMNLRLSPINYTYMDNKFHMSSDEYKHVRYVGWEWEAGIHISRVDLFEHHHSQHGLEYVNPRGDGFPLENSYGIRVHIIGDGK